MQNNTKRSNESDNVKFIGDQKVVSFDNMRDTGLIEIRIKDEFVKRTTTGKKIFDSGQTSACVWKDRRTNIHYGIPLKTLKDGTIQFKRIRLQHGRVFNLDDATDREEWHVVQFWPIIEGALLDTMGISRFIIYDRDIEAQKFLEEYKTKKQAEEYIVGLSDADVMDFALAFHIDVHNNSMNVVRMMLMEMCSQKTASGKNIILEKINDKEALRAVIIFRRSLATGLTQSSPTGYVYKNNVPLGLDENSSIEFIKANKPLMMTMDAESKAGKTESSMVSKKIDYRNPKQILAELKADAQQMGIEKYWLLSESELKAAIEEKKNGVTTEEQEQEVETPVAKKAATKKPKAAEPVAENDGF